MRWAYEQAAATQVDSFMMGPSGFGYLFPGNITHKDDAQRYFARETVKAGETLGMEGYVHWGRCSSLLCGLSRL